MSVTQIEPKGEERKCAIRICRANAHLDAATGKPLTPEESRTQWRELKDDLPYGKWLWMWNNGQAEWDPRAGDSAADEHG